MYGSGIIHCVASAVSNCQRSSFLYSRFPVNLASKLFHIPMFHLILRQLVTRSLACFPIPSPPRLSRPVCSGCRRLASTCTTHLRARRTRLHDGRVPAPRWRLSVRRVSPCLVTPRLVLHSQAGQPV